MEGISRSINIFFNRTGESAYAGFGYYLRNLNYRFEIAGTGYGESAFNDINSQSLKQFCEFYLLYCVQLATGDLLPVAKCSVKNVEFIFHNVCLSHVSNHKIEIILVNNNKKKILLQFILT